MSRKPDPHPEWSGLLAAAQDGDREAYAAFLAGVIPHLREIARRGARDANQAEGAVQAALLAIHRLRHTYDPRRPVGPWLAGILAAQGVRTRRPARIPRLRDLLALPALSRALAPRLGPTG
jgi:RNA polymerase sigma-70 factor (ECF subfamily)